MPKYTLTVEDSFSSAHHLRGYMGRCENMHGHNWKVSLNVQGSKLDSTGMLVDFTILKKILKEATAYLDHIVLNDTPPFDTINPSAENISRFICERVQSGLDSLAPHARVSSVTVWESHTSSCTYEPQLSGQD